MLACSFYLRLKQSSNYFDPTTAAIASVISLQRRFSTNPNLVLYLSDKCIHSPFYLNPNSFIAHAENPWRERATRSAHVASRDTLSPS